MSTSGAEPTLMVSVATLDWPLAAVTCSCTVWLPGVENEVVIRGFPAVKAPGFESAQDHPVIALALSVALETSATSSPVFGEVGNHVKDADGPGRTAGSGGGVTVKVTGALRPRLPASSVCSACSV